MPEARVKMAISITYHTQYGTAPSGTVGYDGFPLEEKHLPVLTYEGYKFIGWYYDEAFTQEAKVGDIAGSYNFYLYAKWVEVPTVKSKMTAIADEIRELSGTTSSLGLDAMATHVGEANDEIGSQTELLAQIVSALEGKAAGSDLTPIADALTEKGVEVPSGAGVGALASLIAAIEVGGESFDPSPFSQILTGTFTTASNTKDFTIPNEAVGTVGFLIVFLMDQGLYLVQLVYVNLGNYYGENALHNHVMHDNGSLSTNTALPTISTDGRTFSNSKQSMYVAGLHYGYALGMVSE